MIGYIYMTINIQNGKRYIGKRKSDVFLTKHVYIGSGKILRNSVKKQGIENFAVELLDTAQTMEELNAKEYYWIEYYNAVDSDLFYNLKPGGDGGFDYINKNRLNVSPEITQKTKNTILQRYGGKVVSRESVLKMVNTRRLNGSYTGRARTRESIEKGIRTSLENGTLYNGIKAAHSVEGRKKALASLKSHYEQNKQIYEERTKRAVETNKSRHNGVMAWHTPESKLKSVGTRKEKGSYKQTPEASAKRILKMRENGTLSNFYTAGCKASKTPEAIEKYKQSRRVNKKHWYTDGKVDKMLSEEEFLLNYENEGFKRGLTHTYKRTEEQNRRMSESVKNAKRKQVTNDSGGI